MRRLTRCVCVSSRAIRRFIVEHALTQLLPTATPRIKVRSRLAATRGTRKGASGLMPHGHAVLWRSVFSVAAVIVDLCMVLLAAALAGGGYNHFAFGEIGSLDLVFEMGAFVALIVVLGSAIRNEYSLLHYLDYTTLGSRLFVLWNVAGLSAMAGAFLTQSTVDFSRATVVLFYPLGFVLLVGGRTLLVAGVRKFMREGRAPVRRVFLLGHEAELEAFSTRYQPWSNGMRIVTAAILRGADDLGTDLALAAASARMLRPDDVFILVPWSDTTTIDACVNAFLRVPAAIHLGPERVLDRFADAKISKFGAIASLNLTGHPLTPLEVVLKRMFDFALGVAALLLAAPVMAVIALAIRLDSQGPVFFHQRRYGFNQQPFRIVKFRSMRTLDNGRVIEQAQKDDPRITAVGRILRRFNLDELPQLINVILGQMSLVGPRPHAMPHDQKFESMIALYARRHNVKPGITGWAQVNGFRGETATNDAMRARVEHDLWYIDNWSFLLDLRCLYLTVMSRKAYRNAR